jgi:hypothetical protein
VEAGDLAQLGSGKKAGGLLGGLGKDAGSCWSSFLAGPHFKVGCVLLWCVLVNVPVRCATLKVCRYTAYSTGVFSSVGR